MKGKQLLIRTIWLLGVTVFTPSIVFAQKRMEKELLNRVFDYRRNYAFDVRGHQSNAYLKYSFITDRRNFTLFLIPNMYTIADGDRAYVGESYCRVSYNNVGKLHMKRQVSVGNIAHYTKALPTALELLTPKLYSTCLFKHHILSPFHRENEHYYRYRVTLIGNGIAVLAFKPKLANTQLVTGQAYVWFETGRITSAEIQGEYDMIDFTLTIKQSEDCRTSQLPDHCELDARFNFAGNRIRAKFEGYYNCPTTLPDSLVSVRDTALMNRLRPQPLEPEERSVYARYYKPEEKKEETDTMPRRKNFWKDYVWGTVGDRLFTTIGMENPSGYLYVRPLINPQYLSYSGSRGLSYKMKLYAQYNFSPHRYLSFHVQLGYNFKYRQLYFQAPLRMTYNPKRDGYAEIEIGNGNRINNSSVLDEIIDEHGDHPDFGEMQLDYFTDNYIKVKNNIEAFDWLNIKAGFSYHSRRAVTPQNMIRMGKPTLYRSFAPVLTLTFRPWADGPVLQSDYERGIVGVFRSDIGYERWEFDAQWKKAVKSLAQLNLRLGAGFYTAKSTNYFLDYDNFRDNNVPGGWDDDWTGQFQLLNASWYNTSRYYVRANASYESPMILASWLPLVGRYVESERFYLSGLLIGHTRPYFEVGYGLTNRYFSVGFFGSFLNTKFQEFGTKFTVELFRRW